MQAEVWARDARRISVAMDEKAFISLMRLDVTRALLILMPMVKCVCGMCVVVHLHFSHLADALSDAFSLSLHLLLLIPHSQRPEGVSMATREGEFCMAVKSRNRSVQLPWASTDFLC